MVSYKPLFRYCLEHDISKAQCREMCGISRNTWTKINRNEEVSMRERCNMANLSKIKRDNMIAFLEELKKTHVARRSAEVISIQTTSFNLKMEMSGLSKPRAA